MCEEVPKDKEDLLHLLFFKVNELIETVNSIEDRLYETEVTVEDELFEIEEKVNTLFDDEEKSRMEEKLRDMRKESRDVRNSLSELEDEIQEVRPA